MLDFIKEPIQLILLFFYNFTNNYGLAILGVTFLVKILLFPLTLKQDKSMQAMKKVQPELNAIKEKYGDDKQLLNQKTMELYQTHKVNPMAGCLPILVQMPILFALFGVLRQTPAELGVNEEHLNFMWLYLSEPDPLYILPILNGLISFIQQKVSGAGDNPQTKNMMYIFPIMMIFISYRMPAGLQLYWSVSSAISLLQQYFILNRNKVS